MRVFSFVVVLSLVLTGCAQRLDEVEDRVTDLQKRTSVLETHDGGSTSTDRELLDSQKILDVRSQVTAMRNEISLLSGRVETLEYERKVTTERLDETTKELDILKSRLDKISSSSSVSSGESSEAMGPEAEYNEALKAHQDGDFEKAEKLFQSFLSKNPKNSLADNALYWIGDGYMNRKNPKKAIVKFQDLMDKFPKSDKKCDAMSRQIEAFKELKMEKEATAFSQVRATECKH